MIVGSSRPPPARRPPSQSGINGWSVTVGLTQESRPSVSLARSESIVKKVASCFCVTAAVHVQDYIFNHLFDPFTHRVSFIIAIITYLGFVG